MTGWLKKRNGFGRNWSWHNQVTVPAFAWSPFKHKSITLHRTILFSNEVFLLLCLITISRMHRLYNVECQKLWMMNWEDYHKTAACYKVLFQNLSVRTEENNKKALWRTLLLALRIEPVTSQIQDWKVNHWTLTFRENMNGAGKLNSYNNNLTSPAL
jgi:hypothetical protein